MAGDLDADFLLAKPFRLADLLEAVEALLARAPEAICLTAR
jgi:DNA-binding response OmpR family regulator